MVIHALSAPVVPLGGRVVVPVLRRPASDEILAMAQAAQDNMSGASIFSMIADRPGIGISPRYGLAATDRK